MWVHGNATEHMYEDVYKGITTGNGTAYTNPNLYTQEIMSDFCGSLQEATKSGIVYGEKITQGNWEFIFAQPRQLFFSSTNYLKVFLLYKNKLPLEWKKEIKRVIIDK